MPCEVSDRDPRVGEGLRELESVERLGPARRCVEDRDFEGDEAAGFPAHVPSLACPAEREYIFLFMSLPHALRSSLFVVTGVYLLAYWVIADPSRDLAIIFVPWLAAALVAYVLMRAKRNASALVSAEP